MVIDPFAETRERLEMCRKNIEAVDNNTELVRKAVDLLRVTVAECVQQIGKLSTDANRLEKNNTMLFERTVDLRQLITALIPKIPGISQSILDELKEHEEDDRHG